MPATDWYPEAPTWITAVESSPALCADLPARLPLQPRYRIAKHPDYDRFLLFIGEDDDMKYQNTSNYETYTELGMMNRLLLLGVLADKRWVPYDPDAEKE